MTGWNPRGSSVAAFAPVRSSGRTARRTSRCDRPMATMNRVVVLGAGGAGKSTMARQIGMTRGIPVLHLDPIYWKPGFVETPWEEMLERVRRFAHERDEWVIEGSAAEAAIDRADTVVFLDLPRRVFVRRFLNRWIRSKLLGGASSSDRPPWGDSLRPDILLWVWRWRRLSRPKVIAAVQVAREQGKTVAQVRTIGEEMVLLKQLQGQPHAG